MIQKTNNNNNNNNIIKQTITLAEDPPHLNFATPDDINDFYIIFVDLFIMSYSKCVVYGSGGFGRMGSLVSYNPYCGISYSIDDGGKLQKCYQYNMKVKD